MTAKRSTLLAFFACSICCANIAFSETTTPPAPTLQTPNAVGVTDPVQYDQCASGLPLSNTAICDPAYLKMVSFANRINTSLDRQGARTTNGLMNEQINESELADIKTKTAAIQAAMLEATKDGKVTVAERKNIEALRKEASDAIFMARNDLINLQARQAAMKKRIESGSAAGHITAEEKTILMAQVEAIDATITSSNADGLTLAERVAIVKAQMAAGKAIYEGKRNAVGTAKPTLYKSKDDLDYHQKAIEADLGRCYLSGAIDSNTFNAASNLLKKYREQEAKAAADGVVEGAEVSVLIGIQNEAKAVYSSICHPGDVPLAAPSSQSTPVVNTANPGL